MAKEELAWDINWELPREEFQAHVRSMIDLVVERQLVIALPIPMVPGILSAALMSLVCSQIDCGGCNAICCKENTKRLYIPPSEAERLSNKYGKDALEVFCGVSYIPMPCAFLKHGKCSIYEDRPSSCVLYPFQPGATNSNGDVILALDSRCPEARRVSMRVYTGLWEIQTKVSSIQFDRAVVEAAAKILERRKG